MNFKEEVTQIKEEVAIIKADVQYIKKMMEDFSLALDPKDDKKEAIKTMMGNLNKIITNDPNMKKHPDIANTINDLFKVVI